MTIPAETHLVEPTEHGFEVTSAKSGTTYYVTTGGACNCLGFKNRTHCSHVDAVFRFGAEQLAEQKRREAAEEVERRLQGRLRKVEAFKR